MDCLCDINLYKLWRKFVAYAYLLRNILIETSVNQASCVNVCQVMANLPSVGMLFQEIDSLMFVITTHTLDIEMFSLKHCLSLRKKVISSQFKK